MPLSPVTGAEPSPFPSKSWPEETVFLYVDGIDLTVFCDRPSLEYAVQQFTQGAVESFKLKLQHFASPHIPGYLPAELPPIREGRVQVIIIKRYSGDPEDYETLASGTVAQALIGDTSWRGSTELHVDTPLKTLKTQLHFVRFLASSEPTDVDRLRRLGRNWRHADFDFNLVGQEAYVTYPMPHYGADSQAYVSGRDNTDYTDRSVDDIVRDINTYVGQASDAAYPVPTRHWWWEARFRDATQPALGIKWFLHIQRNDQGVVGTDLVDAPDPDNPDALVYNQGATIARDYQPVVRRVRVAGSELVKEYIPGGWLAASDTPDENILPVSDGWVRKVAGADGEWDSNALMYGTYSRGLEGYEPVHLWADFRLNFQTQETYLAHDTFKGADEVPLVRSAIVEGDQRFFPPGQWVTWYTTLLEATHNVMGRIGNGARGHTAQVPALALLDARASTCIVRGRVLRHGPGMALILRASYTGDHLLDQAIVMYEEAGGSWTLATWSGGGLSIVQAGGMTLDTGDTLKVNLKYNRIEVFKNDDFQDEYTQEPFDFNSDATWHGVGVLTGLDATVPVWDDFNITTFWADRAMGVGGELGGSEWFWIGYGFVWNVNGTFTMIQGGLTPPALGQGNYGQSGGSYTYATLAAYAAAHGGEMPDDVEYLWADIEKAQDVVNLGYAYDDVWSIGSVQYIDDSTRSLMRKVQWWYQAGGIGEPVLLRELLGLPYNEIYWRSMDDYRSWVAQAAFKDLGGTITNTYEEGAQSDLFYPTGDLADEMTPLVGDYPSTGTIQSDLMVTYYMRQRVGMAVLRQLGEPRVDMRCDVFPQPDPETGEVRTPYTRGMLVRVTNRRAGWVNSGTGDRRKLLVVRAIQRVSAGARGRRPGFHLTLGDQTYDLTDPTRSYLLGPGDEGGMPAQLDVPEGRRGTSFAFREAVTQDKWHGDYLDVRVHPLHNPGIGELPMLTWPAGVREIQIPTGLLPPGTTFELQHRTRTQDGRKSPWSARYKGTTPEAGAYDRPYLAEFPIGDGADAIVVTDDALDMHELQLNEACAIVGWAMVINALGNVIVDVQYASEAARRTLGTSAYVSLCGLDGAKPYVSSTRYSGTANSGNDLRGWDAAAGGLERGDWLRVTVAAVGVGSPTLGTVTLHLKRLRTETEV